MNVPPARLEVRVQPGARRDALIARLGTGEWKLAVTAPPEDGRANEAVVTLIASILGLKRRQVTVARGHASRGKVIEIDGMSADEAGRRLAAALETRGEPNAE
jgi:uncharacterized protein (TIGR00251 family)